MLIIVKNKINTLNPLALTTNYSPNLINKEKNLKIQNKSEKKEYNNTIYSPSSTKEW